MTIAEIQKHWVKPDQEEKKSSSKKRQWTPKKYSISEENVPAVVPQI